VARKSKTRYNSGAMPVVMRELETWDGPLAILLDGSDAAPARPPLHLQAAMGGYLRLASPDGTVLWGLVDKGWYGIELLRGTPPRILAPIRTDDDEAPGRSGTPEYIGWWTRHFARELMASACTPLATGRHALLAHSQSLRFPAGVLDLLLAQGSQFELEWDVGYVCLLQLRAPSSSDDGRIKMWRKRARERRLPPLLVWWCNGVHAHVLLDGHDRLHAALLEGITPDVIALTDVTTRGSAALEEQRQQSLLIAAQLQSSTLLARRGVAANAVLRAGWEPRTAWEPRTPGFPLDGGIPRWLDEVRGTELERLATQ
jgi:hypothetical protein